MNKKPYIYGQNTNVYEYSIYIPASAKKYFKNMLTSYIHGSILKMLQGSKAHILFSPCWDRKEAIYVHSKNDYG